jgi:hypothetical protein
MPEKYRQDDAAPSTRDERDVLEVELMLRGGQGQTRLVSVLLLRRWSRVEECKDVQVELLG